MTPDEKREILVQHLLDVWDNSEDPVGKKLWSTLTDAMEFVGAYEGWEGADKKEEVLAILEEFLDQTDSPGPDFVVDPAILWAFEWAIDALYDAFQGKFEFD